MKKYSLWRLLYVNIIIWVVVGLFYWIENIISGDDNFIRSWFSVSVGCSVCVTYFFFNERKE